jgi:Kae1-associated kinase Bud32
MADKIAQGAEAVIYTDQSTVTKDRFSKKYRHPELDNKLRKSRTRREAKILSKLAEAQFPAPLLVSMDDKEMKVHMSHIPGKLVKDMIDSLEDSGDSAGYLKLFNEIGSKVAVLHNMGIVHHDLTTSNMILHPEKEEVYFIDFGLSFFSDKIEDYAVDLHLLKHAVESRHYKIVDACFDAVVSGYSEKKMDADEVLKRFEKVEKRGRHKSKHA